ncbi:type III-A CRISPR-associated RAMP protein Csm3 [Nitratiruptor tergarcus]|uniref:CRISPR system Cms endoribonuclease Csm3 n=1 Tax=Nitratiruptor tergarcus DSM 16512 TaxID=1069081 RepID=A0A1W1WSL4_9BACT|nr:type III-A CRISPR-associated RAMP protein Csm3 [Nitratiruptor tergarcus]SMC09195.1 CRISPR-associated protein Csm3 [Nitratiruptor tergarcus DSM 16512]
MKLQEIKQISGKIKVLTGLHIGAGNDEIKIGGIDTPVIKNPITNEPYIPGSSIKGKMRTLLEWRLGTIVDGSPTKVNKPTEDKKDDKWIYEDDKKLKNFKIIAKIFGNGATIKNEDIAKDIGPTKVSFYDCYLTKESKEQLMSVNALTESKYEIIIDRFSGTVRRGGLRQIERVPAGAEFEFYLTYMVFNEDDKNNFNYLALGMKLLELTALGGNSSRGYGKVEFFDIEGIDEKFLDNKKLIDIKEIEKELGLGNENN